MTDRLAEIESRDYVLCRTDEETDQFCNDFDWLLLEVKRLRELLPENEDTNV